MWIIVRVLIGIAILFLLEYYFTRKLNLVFKTLFPKYNTKKKKLIIYVFLVLLNLYPVILVFNSVYAAVTKQSISFPENVFADYLLLYPFWILILLILQVSVLFIFADIPLSIAGWINKNIREKLNRIKVVIFLILVLFFIIYIPARIIYDYNTVDIKIVDYKKQNLSDELTGFKIALISDVQADRYTDEKKLMRYIQKVNEQNPDLVLIAGDVITSSPDYINTAAKYIGKIKSSYGVFASVGDHDNWAYRNDNVRSLREIQTALNDYNVEMVNNQVRYLEIDTTRLGITFVTYNYVSGISETTLNNLSASNKAEFKILLTHQPQEFLIQSAAENNYNLFLAGHTHGGQITLLFPFVQLTPTMFETKYIKGCFYFNNMLAVVCSGLGVSLAPVRYNATPNVVVISLQKS